MKKIFYLFTICTILACGKDEINEKENSVANNAKTFNCTLKDSTPFTEQSVTFGYNCDYYPNDPCFETKLKEYLSAEFGAPILSSNPPNNQFLNPVLISSEAFWIDNYTVVDTSTIHEFISPTQANSIFEVIACEIRNELNQLPPTGRTREYKVVITHVFSDHSVCCINNSSTYGSYEIYEQDLIL